ERLRFESLLSRLSAAFIHLPAEEVDSQIERGLQQIVEFLDIDRSSLGQFSEDGSQLLVTHTYALPGVTPFPKVNVAPLFPWYTAKVRCGVVLRFTRLPEELPPEAVQERAYCLREGFHSHLMIPCQVGDAVLGALCVGSFREERDWSDALVQSLQLVGEIFANALARKRAEERETHLREQLALVARVTMMGELAASIVHEVNQPLCAIVSNAQTVQRLLAQENCDMEEVREALADISRDGQRASAVVGRIRNFVRKAPGERSPVAVNDLIREVAVLMRGELARRGVTVKLELAEGLPAVSGDRVQLLQVILNLMTNGVDAMDRVARDLRHLVVRSTADGAEVSVAVTDAGVGIAPDSIGYIFDPFFTTKPHGMGMGLAICKSILKAHGGRIWASPNADHGTTFQFTLPASKEDNP
ncbi:MAG TPA: ATP-binding protein, partial [Gemmataceae bacterium]|nr:ATP-binding protein [Gemmataceae bacterium]